MKHFAAALAAMAVTAFTAVSCDLETSDNGDFDGMWHLRSVDTLATGAACDMSDESIYWLVQADLLILDDKSGANEDIIMRFDLTDDSLRVYSPYIFDREEGDREIESLDQLRPYGVSSDDETFSVTRLTGSKMILESDSLLLNFKKM